MGTMKVTITIDIYRNKKYWGSNFETVCNRITHSIIGLALHDGWYPVSVFRISWAYVT
jgi:hypothetical protein